MIDLYKSTGFLVITKYFHPYCPFSTNFMLGTVLIFVLEYENIVNFVTTRFTTLDIKILVSGQPVS